MIELVRYFAILNVAVLVAAGAFIRAVYARDLPRALDVAMLAWGLTFLSVAAGLLANILSPTPPTPGAKIVLAASTVSALILVGVCVHVVRNRRH